MDAPSQRVVLYDGNLVRGAGAAHAELHALAVADELDRRGVRPVLVGGANVAELSEGDRIGHPWIQMPSALPGYVKPLPKAKLLERTLRIRRLLAYAESLQAKVVWILTAETEWLPLSLALTLPRSKKDNGPALVLTFHSRKWYSKLSRVGLLRRRAYEMAIISLLRNPMVSAICVYTRSLGSWVAHRTSRPVVVLDHPLVYRHRLPSPVDAKRYLGLPDNKPVVGFLGTIQGGKGFDLLLKALHLVPVQGFTLVVAGRVGADAGLGEAPERAIREQLPGWLAESAMIQLGWIPRMDYLRYLAAIDVMVLPYTPAYYDEYASTSGVLSEAGVSGATLVVSDVSNLGDVVRSRGWGFAVPPGDVHELAKAIGLAIGQGRRREASNCLSESWDRLLRSLGLDLRPEKPLAVGPNSADVPAPM